MLVSRRSFMDLRWSRRNRKSVLVLGVLSGKWLCFRQYVAMGGWSVPVAAVCKDEVHVHMILVQ